MLICGRTKSHHYYVVGMSVDHLFVNSEDPTSDVWRVTVGDMFDCEDLAVLLGASILRPKRWVGLKREEGEGNLWELRMNSTHQDRIRSS